MADRAIPTINLNICIHSKFILYNPIELDRFGMTDGLTKSKKKLNPKSMDFSAMSFFHFEWTRFNATKPVDDTQFRNVDLEQFFYTNQSKIMRSIDDFITRFGLSSYTRKKNEKRK